MNTDLYSKGFIVNYKEGDRSLERKKVIHRDSLDDKSYITSTGDTLTSISYKFYKNSLLWFYIADVNNIENPFYLKPGTTLIIPNLDKYDI